MTKASTHVLQRLLSLNLDDRDQGLIRLLQVLDRRLVAERAHGERRPEAAVALRWKLRRSHQATCVISRSE